MAACLVVTVAWVNPLFGQLIDKEDLVLTSDGMARAVIVIGDKATTVEKFAATELQKYIKTISSAELAITTRPPGDALVSRIIIGTPESNEAIARFEAARKIGPLTAHDTGDDGFVIKRLTGGDRNILALASNHPRGVLFAAYSFLETLGVRFFGFGEAGEIIPALATIRIGAIDTFEKPQFKFRIATDNNFVSTNSEMLTKVADWAVKNRFNTFLLSLEDVGHVATKELTKRGMEIWGSGHVWGRLTPEKSLFDSHPEYFPLINGKRTFPGDKVAIAFCYSNPEAMKSFVRKAAAYVRQRPMLNVFACWPQDGSQHWAQCQCEGCKRYTFSEWSLIIMNEMAQAFEADPQLQNVRIQWIAYDESSIPPKKVLPYKQGKNIDLLYANGARDYLSPMDSPANRKCADWLLHDTARRQINTDFKENPTDEDLAAYQRLTGMLNYLKSVNYQGNVSLLEYVNYHIGYWLDLPYLQNVQTGPWDARVFPKDMQFYRAQNIAGWADCFDWPNEAPDPFWNRLMAQLLWNPDADVGKIQSDFYTTYYRRAGSIMQSYFAEVWKLLNREQPGSGDYETFKSLRSRLLEAQKRVSGDSVIEKRIAGVVDWHRSIRLAKTSSNLIPDGSFEGLSLEEGQSANAHGASGVWRITHPLASKLKAVEGHNVLQSSGTGCSLSMLSSNYVFEAHTRYTLEAEIFPVHDRGTLILIAQAHNPHDPGIALSTKSLSGLKSNQWNHVVIEWLCREGAIEENKPIGVSCEGFEDAALDNVVIKARPEESRLSSR